MDEEQLLFLAGEHVTNFDDDVDDLALNVDHVFEADQCDAFDSDVDEAPTTHTMFMDHLKMEMEMEIPSSSNVKLITECSDTTYTCYEVMKDLIKVSKLPQTLISYSSSQSNKCIDRFLKNNVNTSGNKKKDVEPTIEVTLVDDEGKPLTKVDSLGDHDSEDEVASADNDMANFSASKKDGYGTSSLFEQWKDSYVNVDYEFYP
ncbi:hypothetical protein Tco_0888707 [Tanacetum coccineum]